MGSCLSNTVQSSASDDLRDPVEKACSRAVELYRSVGANIGMAAGSTVFREGQIVRKVSILRHGRFKIIRTSQNGRTLLVRIAHPGEILGLSALLSDSPYEITAQGIDVVEFTNIRQRDFLELIRSNPDVALHSALSLNLEYRSALNIASRLALAGSIAGRLAHLILELSDSAHGSIGSHPIDIPLTHEEMASMLGTSRESVTRLLNEFKRRNIVTTYGSTIRVLRRDALEDIL